MEKTTFFSVYSLINDLCDKLVNENSQGGSVVLPDVRKLKTKSFEILLKKSKYNINSKNYVDPLKELDIIYFAAKIKARNDCKKLKHCERFEQILNDVSKNDYFLNGSGKSVLIFLLFVKDSLFQYTQYENEYRQPLLVPGPFTLHLEYSRSLSYPFNEIKWCTNKLEHFKGLTTILDVNNPYLPRFLFEKIKSEAPDETNRAFKFFTEKKPFKCVSYRYLKSVTQHSNVKSIENQRYNIEHSTNKKPEKMDSQPSGCGKRFGWSWESLGSTIVQNENKFGSELDTSMPMEILINENSEMDFQAKIVNTESFLADLKSLLVGIESESFYLDENITFHMVKNLTISSVVPNVLYDFVQEYLECGTSYRRMQIMTLKKKFQLIFDGFIFKALCCAIEDYLLMFRQFVFSYDDLKLLEFHERIKKIIRQISGLAYILTIHPKVNINMKPPKGSQFLGYIYKEIMRVTQPDMLALLVFILKRCCHVYFENLQKWIFLGHLDDPSNELFICFADYYHPNTKYYFDKAYFIRKEVVPGFFQGYEDYILQCGKYTMLLKAFNPNHPIFSLQYPRITVCLSFEELKKVEEACKKYQKEALNVCQSPVSVQDIYNSNIEKKKNFFKLVLEKSQKNLENWTFEKAQLSYYEAAKKRKYFEEMSAQMELKRLHKIKEKMKNINEEREFLKQQEKREIEISNIEQQQILKQIGYLEELHAITEKNGNKLAVDSEFKLCGEEFESEFKNCNTQNQNFQNDDLNINPILNSKSYETSHETDIMNSNQIESDKEEFRVSESLPIRTDIENKNLTEAERNKIKVLGSEYNIFNTTSKDLNYNSLRNNSKLKTAELSALQKNKIKMMQSNPFEQSSSDYLGKNINLDLNTERAKNKKKILESEFYIFTTEPPSGTTNTPMSTSSDSYLEDNFLEAENTKNIKSNADLKQNVDIKKDAKSFKNKFPISEEVSPCLETEQCNNFDCEESRIFNIEKLIQNEEVKENEDSYKRCIELILNNFKSKPTTGLIQLKDISNQFIQNHDNEKFKEISKKQFNLNSLSVITLTEFLQKSVNLPLRTHLQIVNNEVMRVFLVDLDLIEHFNSLRNYFFLMDGEFSSIICDELISKLESGASPTEMLNYQTLHSVLDKAIGSSNCGSDKNSSKLSFIVSDLPEKFDLASPSVLSNLCLSYKVTWPLNLILNPETLDKYGDIFKYLFKVKRMSWVLEQSFIILKESAKLIGKEILTSPQYGRIQLIRHKFFHFVHALRNHVTSSALQASWKEFEDDLLKAKCIEEIYRKHTTYIKKILFLCMLNKSSTDFYKAIENIFKITLRFYRNLKCREWQIKVGANYYIHPRFEKLLIDEIEFEKLVKYVIYLGNKIVKRGYQEEIGEFINLVNYNQYYLVGV